MFYRWRPSFGDGYLSEVTLLLDGWAEIQIWTHLTLKFISSLVLPLYFRQFQILVCLSNIVSGNMVIDMYLRSWMSHREYLELCSYHKILVKQMLEILARLILALFLLCIFLAHGWLTITTITLVLNSQHILVTNVEKIWAKESARQSAQYILLQRISLWVILKENDTSEILN